MDPCLLPGLGLEMGLGLSILQNLAITILADRPHAYLTYGMDALDAADVCSTLARCQFTR